MLQVDLPGALALGQLFAIISRKYLERKKDRFTHQLMGPISWYFTLVYAPVGMFALICWPAWETMYWWKWIEQPDFKPLVAFFYVAFYLSMILIGIISYILAHSLLLNNKDRTVYSLAILGGITAFMPFFLWPENWLYIGTYAQFNSVHCQAEIIFKTPSFIFPGLLAIGYCVIGTIIFSFWLKKYSSNLS
jgi:hypothetical protein